MKNKLKKIFITLTFSGIYLFANPIQTIKKEDLMKETSSINEKNFLENSKKIKLSEGVLKKPFYNQQGKCVENLVKVIYNNNEGGETEIIISDKISSINEMNSKYSKAMATAKDYSLTYSYVKVEAILKTESKNKEELKRVISILNGTNNIKNSEVHFIIAKS